MVWSVQKFVVKYLRNSVAVWYSISRNQSLYNVKLRFHVMLDSLIEENLCKLSNTICKYDDRKKSVLIFTLMLF